MVSCVFLQPYCFPDLRVPCTRLLGVLPLLHCTPLCVLRTDGSMEVYFKRARFYLFGDFIHTTKYMRVLEHASGIDRCPPRNILTSGFPFLLLAFAMNEHKLLFSGVWIC